MGKKHSPFGCGLGKVFLTIEMFGVGLSASCHKSLKAVSATAKLNGINPSFTIHSVGIVNPSSTIPCDGA